ncbi:Methionyl-tRNA formyltransferase [compost metagenome]
MPILETDNYITLHDKLKNIGAELLVKTLDKMLEGNLERTVQPSGESYAPMINKEMTKLDFSKNSNEIFNFVRGLSPFPGTYMIDSDNKRYKVYDVKTIEKDDIDSNIENGTVFSIEKDTLSIKCNNGLVNIVLIQPENSRKMDISDFLKSSKLKVGDILK